MWKTIAKIIYEVPFEIYIYTHAHTYFSKRLGENHSLPETTNIPSGLKDASKVALLKTGFTL